MPEPPPLRRPRRSRAPLWLAGTIVLIGAGAAVAILLVSGGGSSSTTVVSRANGTTAASSADGSTEPATTSAARAGESGGVGAIEAGRYVQAGSFKTVTHAEEERERLAAAGIEVDVVSSDGAAEFYPGFQVLLVGPVTGPSQEQSTIKALRDNGVPSAFARDLTPATRTTGASEVAGRWTGILERSSGEHPALDASLQAVLEIAPDGETGTLEEGGCTENLTLSESGPATFSYAQDTPCVSGGELFVRPTPGQLMVSLLPLDSDALTLGSLSPG